jgi:uncharacterized protein (TIGR00369 family)
VRSDWLALVLSIGLGCCPFSAGWLAGIQASDVSPRLWRSVAPLYAYPFSEASSLNDLVKQPNSQMCFVCGMENPIGLKQFFYEDSTGRVVATFTPEDKHQGYPGVLHGGIAAALLDEVLGRLAIGKGVWLMTARMEIRYRRAIPLDQSLTVVGEVIRDTRRLMEAKGELCLADGSVAAVATATYLPVPKDKLEDMEQALGFWQVVPD